MKQFNFFLMLALFVTTIIPATALGATCIPTQANDYCFGQTVDSGLVVCGNPGQPACGFDKLIQQVQVAINFLIFRIAAPLAAVMFAYAGYLYVTNRGNEGQINEAHEIFWNVFIGLVVALAAWLTINFILVFFLGASSPFNFLTTT